MRFKMNNGNTCDLKSCLMCKLCLTDWLPAIGANRQNFKIKKGQSLFKEGDAVSGIYFVYDGVYKVHKAWDQEKELIIRFARNGDILGHLGLGKEPYYPVSATAIESGTVCFVALPFFESTLKVNIELTYQLLLMFANQLQESEKRMRNLAHMPVKERIAQVFLSLKNQFGLNQDGYINVSLSRQDLSSYASVTYETLFKVINEMLRKGLIAVDGKNIRITDEAGLRALTLTNLR